MDRANDAPKRAFTEADALAVIETFRREGYEVDEDVVTAKRLAVGMTVELEHGRRYRHLGLDVTGGTDDPMTLAKIAYSHLVENPGVRNGEYRYPDYYFWLERQERDAETFYRHYEAKGYPRPAPIQPQAPPAPFVEYGKMYD